MNRSLLPGLPTDGHDFKQIVAVDQIARIEFIIEKDVWAERRIGNLRVRTEIQHVIPCDLSALERPQLYYEIINAYQMLARHNYHLKQKENYRAGGADPVFRSPAESGGRRHSYPPT
jgi:hypothetical protein